MSSTLTFDSRLSSKVSIGLNGVVDFLLGRSPEVLGIEAPVVVIVDEKKLISAVALASILQRC
ncbi:MAG: hypothetical protein AAF215_26170 [Cyanobacteria bacterium P01_A01_bin.123]